MTRRILIAVLLVLTSCQKKPSTPPDVIVRVGDRMVTLADFKRYLERNTGTDLAQVNAEVSSAMLDQYIEEIVLSEHAGAHGVEVPAEEIATAVRKEPGATVMEKRDEMRRQKLLAGVAGEVGEPSEADIRSYYEQNRNEFKTGEEVRVRQILIHDEGIANDIAARLKKGGSFEELSSQHSLAPNAKRGGEIGYVTRGELPKMFEDEIFALTPGKVSNVIRTDNSFHIFKVEERRPPGMLDLAGATPIIRDRLREEEIRKRMTALVTQSRSDITVAVLTKRLPFSYSGSFPKAENE